MGTRAHPTTEEFSTVTTGQVRVYSPPKHVATDHETLRMLTQALVVDLVEMDRETAIVLDSWPSAAALVEYVRTGRFGDSEFFNESEAWASASNHPPPCYHAEPEACPRCGATVCEHAPLEEIGVDLDSPLDWIGNPEDRMDVDDDA
jgi:hypothetical protein